MFVSFGGKWPPASMLGGTPGGDQSNFDRWELIRLRVQKRGEE